MARGRCCTTSRGSIGRLGTGGIAGRRGRGCNTQYAIGKCQYQKKCHLPFAQLPCGLPRIAGLWHPLPPAVGSPNIAGGQRSCACYAIPLDGGLCSLRVLQRMRGAAKKNRRTPPRAFAKSRTRPPTIRLFLPCFLLIRFSGVSRQGEFKNTMQMFLQKVHVESFSQNNISTSVLPQLFLFHHGYGCCSAMGVQKHYQKIRVERFLQKTRPKSQNRFFLRSFV
jgi:hypothetical protein